jgi:hypothetical protein
MTDSLCFLPVYLLVIVTLSDILLFLQLKQHSLITSTTLHFHAYVATLFINLRTILHTTVSTEMLPPLIIPNMICLAGSVCCWLKNVMNTLFITIGSTALGGPWTPLFFWGFITIFYAVGLLASCSTPHLEDQGIPFCLGHHPSPVWHGRPYL